MKALAAFLRGFDRLVLMVNFLASLLIVGLMFLMVADVAMRSLFNAPITGVNELMEIAIVAMLYMQVTQALRDDRHTRSDAFFTTVSERWPAAGHGLNLFFAVSGLALMCAILWGGGPRILEALSAGYTIGTRGVFLVPEWPIRAVIVFGCGLMAVQFLILGIQAVRALLGRMPINDDKSPPKVPHDGI